MRLIRLVVLAALGYPTAAFVLCPNSACVKFPRCRLSMAAPSTADDAAAGPATTESSLGDGDKAGPPQLPAVGETARSVVVDGEATKLDDLGPVIVTKDGKMRRIEGWDEMSQVFCLGQSRPQLATTMNSSIRVFGASHSHRQH